MKNVYRYGCVWRYCEKVLEVFDVDFLYVFFLLNYFFEGCLNEVKNVMFFLSFWYVFGFVKDFIEWCEFCDDNK